MPKNLGLYNDDLSTPRKQDVDACYGPNNAPPYPVTSVSGKTGAVTLTKANVGLNNVDNVKQYSANNPPPYPVTSVNSKSGAVTLSKGDVGLGNVDNVKQYSKSNPPPYPVTSVNGKTGDVTVSAELPEHLVKYDTLAPIETTTPINADTLQGHAASYFATKTDVSALSAVVDSNTDDITALQSSVNGKVSKSGDTMTGALIAQNNTNYSVAQVRNIIISTSDPSGGNSGDIWIKYVE